MSKYNIYVTQGKKMKLTMKKHHTQIINNESNGSPMDKSGGGEGYQNDLNKVLKRLKHIALPNYLLQNLHEVYRSTCHHNLNKRCLILLKR